MNPQIDEKAIRERMEQLRECWAAGDAERYAALFTEDADYIAFDGVNQKNRAAIAVAHKPLFEKWLQSSRLVEFDINIRFLAPDVALVHSSGNTILAGKSQPAPERESIQTLVAVKQNGEWRFTAFHNTRIRPIAQSIRNVIAWQLADLIWKLIASKRE